MYIFISMDRFHKKWRTIWNMGNLQVLKLEKLPGVEGGKESQRCSLQESFSTSR